MSQRTSRAALDTNRNTGRKSNCLKQIEESDRDKQSMHSIGLNESPDVLMGKSQIQPFEDSDNDLVIEESPYDENNYKFRMELIDRDIRVHQEKKQQL